MIALFRIFLQPSIGHRNFYKETENRRSRSDLDATAGQTCDIVRFTALVHTVFS